MLVRHLSHLVMKQNTVVYGNTTIQWKILPQMGVWEDLSSNIPTRIGSNFDNFYAQGSHNLLLLQLAHLMKTISSLEVQTFMFLPMVLVLWIM